jgi:L-ascorbate metabolism protein UlaG (beta-lactamase superfamily)
MKLTWWGHACFLLETAKHRVVIDPFLSGNPKAPVKAEDVRCDFILISHGHSDHVGDAVDIAKQNGATIIATYEIATFCGDRGAKSHAMNIGGAHEFPFGRVKLTVAHHSSGYDTDDGVVYMGDPTGFLIAADGRTIYHAGDSALFSDMKLIGEMNRIDVALLPIGDNFTMGVDDAAKAVEFLKPRIAIPMHYNTFDLIAADPRQFAQKAARHGAKIEIIDPGESIEL